MLKSLDGEKKRINEFNIYFFNKKVVVFKSVQVQRINYAQMLFD